MHSASRVMFPSPSFLLIIFPHDIIVTAVPWRFNQRSVELTFVYFVCALEADTLSNPRYVLRNSFSRSGRSV